MNDPKRMAAIKKTLLEQKVANTICSKLKYKMDQEAIMKNAEASRKAMEEAIAKIKAKANVADTTKKPEEKK